MVDKRLFRVIVLGGIALAPVAVLAPGCGDDEGGSADAGFPDEGAADTRHDDFPSEGPMLIDGGNDVTVDAPADVSPDARDAADGTDGFPNEGPIPLDSGADG